MVPRSRDAGTMPWYKNANVMMRFAFVQCVRNSPVYVIMMLFVNTAI